MGVIRDKYIKDVILNNFDKLKPGTKEVLFQIVKNDLCHGDCPCINVICNRELHPDCDFTEKTGYKK